MRSRLTLFVNFGGFSCRSQITQGKIRCDFVIANAFRQKLRKWPKIQNHDYVGLRNFSDYLNNVLVAKESNRSLAILDDENENHILLYKILDLCLIKWEDIVSSALMNDRGFPSFAEFCKLLRIQSKSKNNPVTSVRLGASPQSTSNATPRFQGFLSHTKALVFSNLMVSHFNANILMPPCLFQILKIQSHVSIVIKIGRAHV